MQDSNLRLLQRTWVSVFVLCSVVYSLVLLKLSTPVINCYSSDLILPSIIAKLPRGFDVKRARFSWINLRPFIVLSELQALSPENIPYVSKISDMNMSVDLFKSYRLNKWIINDINIGEVNLNFTKSDLVILNANKVVSNIILKTKSNYEQQQNKVVIPQNLYIDKVVVNMDKHNLIGKNAWYKDSGYTKTWQLQFNYFDSKPLNISAKFLLQEEGGVLNSSKGSVKMDANLPKYLLEFIPSPIVINKFSGKLDIDFSYARALGVTLHVKHDVSSDFNYKKEAAIKLENFRGSSRININSNDKFNVSGEVNDVVVNGARSAGFKYYLKNNSLNNSELMLTYFELSNINVIAPYIFDKKNKGLRILKMPIFHGAIKDLVLQWSGNKFEEIKNIYFDLTDFGVDSYSLIPGVEGVNANVAFTDNKGEIKFFAGDANSNKQVIFHDKRISDKKIIFKAIPMQVEFYRVNDDWLFNAEKIRLTFDGADIKGSAKLKLQPQQYPKLDVALQVEPVNLTSLKKVFPVKILPKGLNKYLGQSLESGWLKHNTIKVKSKENTAKFELKYSYSSELSDAKIKYATSWPELSNIYGKLLLDNNSLNLKINKAYTLGQKVDFGEVIIKNFNNPVVESHVRTKFDLAAGLGFIDKSPLKHSIGKYFSNAVLSGLADLDVGFQLNLNKSEVDLNSLYGKVGLHEDKITFNNYSVDLAHTNGSLQFDAKKMWGEKLTAIQNSSNLDISLSSDANELAVNLKGDMPLGQILPKYIPSSLAKMVHGTPYVNCKVRINTKGEQVVTSIDAESNAGGIAVDMPPPLALSLTDKSPVLFKANILDDKIIDFSVGYAKDVNLIWQAGATQHTELLTLRSPAIKYSDWEDFLDGAYADFKLPPMQLNLAELNIYGFKIASPSLLIKKDGDVAEINIDSNDASGIIKFKPSNFLSMDLDKLRINSINTDYKAVDKLEGMDYKIKAKQLYYLDRVYDNVNVELKEKYSGYDINDLSLSWEKNKVSLKGYWQHGAKPKTYLEGYIDSDNLGDVLAGLPDFDSIKGGTGEAKFKLSWPEGLENIAVKDMRGIVSFNLANGKIYNLGETAETGIGFGMLFNLLSLNSIFNKVSLDFSDLDHESYPFDELIGDFTLGQGAIKTDKIMIKGGLGTVYSRGSIDIENNNYDLYLTIMPIVTSSIPTIAALAGGPVAGIIAWAASQIIEEPVSEMALQAYRITGALTEPVISQLDKNNLPPEIVLQ
ncbi:MAG: hypothetical protein HON55_02690 [Legionellales bacterium]|nr:hypothetical protein [Legionellales bacterium]